MLHVLWVCRYVCCIFGYLLLAISWHEPQYQHHNHYYQQENGHSHSNDGLLRPHWVIWNVLNTLQAVGCILHWMDTLHMNYISNLYIFCTLNPDRISICYEKYLTVISISNPLQPHFTFYVGGFVFTKYNYRNMYITYVINPRFINSNVENSNYIAPTFPTFCSPQVINWSWLNFNYLNLYAPRPF